MRIRNVIFFIGAFLIANMPLSADTNCSQSSCATKILYNNESSDLFNDFCINILQMQNLDEWKALLQNVKDVYPSSPGDVNVFKQLKSLYAQSKPIFHSYFLYQSLKNQQNAIGDLVMKMFFDKKNMNGYVEIGGPCRYADYIESHMNIHGKRYAIHDHKSITDILESGKIHLTRGFVPYDEMISLHDYDPISSYDIPDQSVDLVTCFIGLHHISIDKLDAFLDSVKRILRPGGVFLLRDHDAYNENVFNLASTAHTVFNAIAEQSSSSEEEKEIRNFKSIAGWVVLLEQHGFIANEERSTQNGDPTLNTLVSFVKPISDENIFLQKLREQSDYVRLPHQTFLTAPEWFNVDCAQAYGDFVTHTAWYEFPFWQSIKTYWHIFGQSFNQARSVDNLYDILTKSDYLWTCLFIGTFMTVEYGLKSIIAWPLTALGDSFYKTIDVAIKNFPLETLKLLPDTIIIKEQHLNMISLEVPRYGDFQKTMHALASSKGEIIEIGGQRIIQVKVRCKNSQEGSCCIEFVEEWAEVHAVKLSYTWRAPGLPYVYGSLMVPVSQLQSLIRDSMTSDFEVMFIHDF